MSEAATEENEVVDGTDVLGQSDEDFLNMAPPAEEEEVIEEPVLEEEEEEPVAEVVAEPEEEEEAIAEDVVEELTETIVEDTEEVIHEPQADETFSDNEADTEEELQTEEVSNQVDYKVEYERLMAPFKANGKEIKINSVDDAIRLMQMGSDYTAKMTGLKPSMKLMKMLENNDLLNEDKLSYLIDLDKKNPEAITKLIKDSGIDPLDVDVSEDTNYNPSNYSVSDAEVELENVLESIKSTPTYGKTMDMISNHWDDISKNELLKEPKLITILNDHMASGVYDQINKVVENERMLGRLNGLSNLEAYKQVGDAIQARSGFAGQQAPPVATEPSTPNTPVIDTKIKDRKRAASSPKTAPSKKAKPNFNPLNMSDEDFANIVESDFN